MSYDLSVPSEIMNDPRHLIPECRDCRHRKEEGLCGLNLHPRDEWDKPEGCTQYDFLESESGGDPGPESLLEE